MICTAIQRQAGQVDERAWTLLLRGAGLVEKQPGRPSQIGEAAWDLACQLEQTFPRFTGLCAHILDTTLIKSTLTRFEELLLLKVTNPEMLLEAVQSYVRDELGPLYAESPLATMEALFASSNSATPMIFVLSQGADPTQQVIQFAHKMNFYERL